jgi:hypothetical protein
VFLSRYIVWSFVWWIGAIGARDGELANLLQPPSKTARSIDSNKIE